MSHRGIVFVGSSIDKLLDEFTTNDTACRLYLKDSGSEKVWWTATGNAATNPHVFCENPAP